MTGLLDLKFTNILFFSGVSPQLAKIRASSILVVLNFTAWRFIIFPERPSKQW